MTGESAYPPCDEPHDWVIFVSSLTTDQAMELGRILGQNGYTGTFHDGPYAHHICQYRRLKDDYARLLGQLRGGDEVGEGETVHEA